MLYCKMCYNTVRRCNCLSNLSEPDKQLLRERFPTCPACHKDGVDCRCIEPAVRLYSLDRYKAEQHLKEG